jgi:hypothetical protein
MEIGFGPCVSGLRIQEPHVPTLTPNSCHSGDLLHAPREGAPVRPNERLAPRPPAFGIDASIEFAD